MIASNLLMGHFRFVLSLLVIKVKAVRSTGLYSWTTWLYGTYYGGMASVQLELQLWCSTFVELSNKCNFDVLIIIYMCIFDSLAQLSVYSDINENELMFFLWVFIYMNRKQWVLCFCEYSFWLKSQTICHSSMLCLSSNPELKPAFRDLDWTKTFNG